VIPKYGNFKSPYVALGRRESNVAFDVGLGRVVWDPMSRLDVVHGPASELGLLGCRQILGNESRTAGSGNDDANAPSGVQVPLIPWWVGLVSFIS
jgi:hypothetical protein